MKSILKVVLKLVQFVICNDTLRDLIITGLDKVTRKANTAPKDPTLPATD